MVKRHIKNFILINWLRVEGRLLREQHERKIHFYRAIARKISVEPCLRKASLERKPISYTQKIIIFPEKKMMIFVFPSFLFSILVSWDKMVKIDMLRMYYEGMMGGWRRVIQD